MDDDEIESWASIVMAIAAAIFCCIGAAAVVVASCFAWGYYSWHPKCGTVAALVTKECQE